MNKLVIATAISALLMPASFAIAESQVKIYGSLRGFVDYVHAGGNTKDAFTLHDGSSRIGFKGSDKINHDLSVIWQIESKLNTAKGEGTWASRNSFIGLESNLGTLRVGQFETAYTRMDTSGPQAALFDNYGASVDPKQSYGFYGRANTRLKNSIHYETPTANNFVGRISYAVDNNAQNQSNSWISSLSATYSINGLSIGGAYQYAKNHTLIASQRPGQGSSGLAGTLTELTDAQVGSDGYRPAANASAYKLAVNYLFNTGLNIGLGWEHIEDKLTYLVNNKRLSGKYKQDTVFLGINYPIQNWLLQGGYGQASKIKPSGYVQTPDVRGTNAKMALLGTQYTLSKQSRIYGYLHWVQNGEQAQFSTGYDALNNTASPTSIAGTGKQNGYGVSFGIRHDF